MAHFPQVTSISGLTLKILLSPDLGSSSWYIHMSIGCRINDFLGMHLDYLHLTAVRVPTGVKVLLEMRDLSIFHRCYWGVKNHISTGSYYT
jgi:hypothetical protein